MTASTEIEPSNHNTNRRRNLPGTTASNFCRWPDETFEEMDSTLAVQQFIQQTIRKNVNDVDSILTAPETQDEGVWKYEHLRQFCMELNGLAVALQSECQPESCSQMTATEQWIFLCAAHKTPKECPAIDYTRHTLDGAACLLNSNKYFPSRVSIKVIKNSHNEFKKLDYDIYFYCFFFRNHQLQNLAAFVEEFTEFFPMHTSIIDKFLRSLNPKHICVVGLPFL